MVAPTEVLPSILFTLDNRAELDAKRAEVFSDDAVSGWVLLNYTEANTVHFAESGTGDVDELRSHLRDDQIQYALVRMGGIQERGTLKTTVRDVFVTWIGPDVDPVERTLKAANEVDAQSFLEPFHAALVVLNRDNFTNENVIDRSHPLAGSHVID